MNIMKYQTMFAAVAAAALSFAAGDVVAGDAAAPYKDSSIDARLNVTVKPDTDVVHFVRDNADPNVITKVYRLKHANPYELKTYLRQIVQTRKVDDCDTNIQPICYTDGTSFIMISAEDYRFEDSPAGQGFDTIIKELDRPKIQAVSGRPVYTYNPMYRSVRELKEMVTAIGADIANEQMNNVSGNDAVTCDHALNLMFFKTTPFSRDTITKVLKEYDRPYPEVRAKITVYEIYAENDTKLGMDFQAWKNNDGVDFFSGGGRFMRNHNGVDLVKGAGWSDTRYFKFNPKWNTKYIDFLTSKGKAKVMHTAELTLRSNTTGVMERTTQVFLAKATEDTEFGAIEDYAKVDVAAGTVVGTDMHGKAITVSADTAVTVLQLGSKNKYNYTLRIDKNADASFVIGGSEVGKKAIAGVISDEIELVCNDIAFKGGKKIQTEASDSFGFRMELTPSVSEKATTIKVNITNSSLIGYTSDGNPRIQQGASVNTDFMISNSGTKLVIGGLEKRDVIRVSGGVPILKDIPLLGWAFSTESESTKKSQLLVVAEIMPEFPRPELLDKLEKKLEKAGESNTFGYRQFLIDGDR